MRQNGLETGFWGGGRWAQSGALSAKPRVVRGLGQLGIALSEFEVKLLAEEQGFEPWIRLTVYRISSPAHSTTLPSLRYRTGLIISMGSLFKIVLLLLAMLPLRSIEVP